MSYFKARVYVKLKGSVLDPEGKTIKESLHRIGYDGVNGVKAGKFYDVELEAGSLKEAKKKLDEITEEVLSNPVIENSSIEIREKE